MRDPDRGKNDHWSFLLTRQPREREWEVRMGDSLETRIRSIVAEQLGLETTEVSPDAHILEDLGADSLDVVELMMTLEEAFELSRALPARELRDSEREFLNYLRAFEAIDGLRDQRQAVLTKHDLRSLHQLLVDGVRGGQAGAGEFRRLDVKVGDVQGRARFAGRDRPLRAARRLLVYVRRPGSGAGARRRGSGLAEPDQP